MTTDLLRIYNVTTLELSEAETNWNVESLKSKTLELSLSINIDEFMKKDLEFWLWSYSQLKNQILRMKPWLLKFLIVYVSNKTKVILAESLGTDNAIIFKKWFCYGKLKPEFSQVLVSRPNFEICNCCTIPFWFK